MRTLKDLTPEECVHIASIAEPNVQWKLIQSRLEWDGFDLINADCEDSIDAKYVFQIDYRPKAELQSKSRFRLYVNLYEYEENIDKFSEYLDSIQCSVNDEDFYCIDALTGSPKCEQQCMDCAVEIIRTKAQ